MKKNNKKGFTLVELVIVVAVMAILVAIAIPTVGAVTRNAKVATYNSNAKTIESMIKLYVANNDDGSKAPTADGVSADTVKKALTEAKLGINGTSDYEKFYFDPVNEVVRVYTKAVSGSGYTAPAAASGDLTITFANGTPEAKAE